MSDLPYSDPSNPALPSPLFSDVSAVRADHMRANNAAIFADLIELNARNPELVALTSGSFKTAALANANTYNGRSLFTCTAGVSDTPSAGVWLIIGYWNPTDSSGRFVCMSGASLETWEIKYSGAAWGTWTKYTDADGNPTDANAVHVDDGGEIAGIDAKTTPGGSDLLLIEDVADLNKKKKITINSLPAPFSKQSQPVRVVGDVYRNTTGKTVFVKVALDHDVGAAYTDAANPPTTLVDSFSVNGRSALSFMVLNGNYYKVTASGSTIIAWTEWAQ